MLISGNTLPVVPGNLSEQRRVESYTADVNRQSSNSRETVEYIFRADIEDQPSRSRSSFTGRMQIDPANLKAVHQYIDTQTDAPFKGPQQGRLLDIFI